MKGFGLRPGMKNLDNQIQVLYSYALAEKCLQELSFGIDYYTRDRVNMESLYPHNPIIVTPDNASILPYEIEFEINFISEDSFEISAEENDYFQFNEEGTIGELLDGGQFKFRIERSPGYWHSNVVNKTIYFSFHSTEYLLKGIRNRLNIESVTNEGSTIELSLEGINWKKDIDFLTKLIEVFQRNNLEEKNLEADRTIKFIDDQLKDISDSLIIAEDRLQDFRSQNRVMDISEQVAVLWNRRSG